MKDDVRLVLLVAWRSLFAGILTVRCMCWVESAALLAGDDGGPRETEASPPERRERDVMARSLSLSAKSVIASVARWAAERRGRDDIFSLFLFSSPSFVVDWADWDGVYGRMGQM